MSSTNNNPENARRGLFDLVRSIERRSQRVCDALCELDSKAFVSGVEWDDDGRVVPGSEFTEWDEDWDADRLRAAIRQVTS